MSTKILLIHFTPPGVVGGVEHILNQHIEILTSRGFEVHTVAGRPSDTISNVTVIPEIDAARPVNALLEAELFAGVVSDRFEVTHDRILRRLFPLADAADFVIAHNAFTLHFSLPLTAVLWQLAARRAPGSVISWSHDLSWTNPLYLPGMRAGYPWELLRLRAPNTRYITISEERKAELRALWNGRGSRWVRVVPNGIDPNRFLRLGPEVRDLVRNYRLFERDVVLLLPVRITRRKNVELGIRTLSALRAQNIDAIFLISGPQAPHHPGRSSEYLVELKQLSRELGVESDTVFAADALGHNLDEASVSELYSIADVLFFPSSQEGFGLPILEAALARLPVVVSDIPVFREVGGAEVQYVSLQESPDKIAEIVMGALATPTSRLYKRVLQTYRWDAIFEEHLLPLFRPMSGDE